MPKARTYWSRYAALVIFGIIVCALAAYATFPLGTSPVQKTATAKTQAQTVQIGGTSVRVTIADTPATREKGLGGRIGLADDEGMLFVFPRDGKYAFWMKDMSFSIDIIWISTNRRVVFIAPSVSPATYPNDFVPPTPARYVLEVPAGFTQAHGVKVGDMAGL